MIKFVRCHTGGAVRRVLQVLTVLGLVSSLAGCTAAMQVSPLPELHASRTSVAVPTATPSPTNTPRPTDTCEPTETPLPTATAQPTANLIITPTITSATLATATTAPLSTPFPTPTPTVLLSAIRSITVDRVGEEVTLEARVVDAVSFSKGFQFTLDDGTGEVVLLMWHNVYDDCWDAPKLNIDALVRVTGEISEYEGRLEIQPRFGGDVKAVQAAMAQAPRRDIGSISGVDEGQRVVIEGRVVRTEGLSSGVKVFLADETGEILVLIWRSVLDRIVDNTGLGTPGSVVRVVGPVQKYRGNLEIVPALPNDVMVLEMPQQETE
jgi:DNA/RNA endonuclease YhcR with UshA esterase domain